MDSFIEKVSGTVEKESQQVQENVSEAARNATQSVEGVADEGKQKAIETKKSIGSLVSHGFSRAEDLVHSARDYVDHKGTHLQGKMGDLVKTVSWGSAEKKSDEADPLPVSGGVEGSSSTLPPPVATDSGLPENQPLLKDTVQTRSSWTNCCGLCDCLTSSNR